MGKLIARIDSNTYLSEFEFASIKRDIDRLPNPSVQETLYALAYAAFGKVENAKKHFEAAITISPDKVHIQNYRTYLKKLHEYLKTIELTYKYADKLEDPHLTKEAYEIAFCFERNLLKAEAYLNKYLKYLSKDERLETHNAASYSFKLIREQLASVDLDEKYLPIISTIAHQVASEYKIDLSINNIYVHEGLCSLEFEAEAGTFSITEQQLSDANYELAMRIAGNEFIYNQPVTAFFRFTNHPIETGF
ncbi:hypothetical protein ACK34X_10170 [Aeromonas veronii]